MAPRKTHIDTDPGQDASRSCSLASPFEEIDAGHHSSRGNRAAVATEKNARIHCELAGRPKRVCLWAVMRQQRKLVTAEYVHGKPVSRAAAGRTTMPLQDQHAVDFIIETLRVAERHSHPSPIGPLTTSPWPLERP
jgi:purine nucleosidase